MKKVLVLGGGFAGIEAAINLCKYNFDVTLISDRDYLYIYPISIWIPTGNTSFADVTISLERLRSAHGFKLIIDEVVSIKSLEKKVYCKSNSYDYETLVVAIGSGKMKHKGLENTLSICGNPNESLKIKEKIDTLISGDGGKIAMGFGGNPKDSSNVRGGPAFELLFNVHNKLKKLGVRDKFELTFFAPMSEPGKRMGAKALKMMDLFYKKYSIKQQVGKKILEFKPDGISFEDDIFLNSDLTMFIPAGNGHKVFEDSDLPLSDAGLIKIDDYCMVKENVFAIGDCVELKGPSWRAKQGHVAEVMARAVAFNINAIDKGKKEREGYLKHLNILCIMDSGDGAAFVYRSDKKAIMIPMPIVGHWLKKGWGWYYKSSKLGKIPRIPGM